MIPWYSVTYSDGLEHIFISYKLVGVIILVIALLPVLIGAYLKLIRRLYK
jgi:hypothetical protein